MMGKIGPFLRYVHSGLFSERVSLEKRITFAMVLCAMGGELIGFVESALIGLTTIAWLLPLISFFILIGITIWGFNTKKTNLFAFIAISISALILFPLMFFANDGAKGGMPYYFLLVPVCTALALRGKRRICVFIFILIEYPAMFYIQHIKPEITIPMSPTSAFIDQICSLLIASIVLFFFSYIVSKQNFFDRQKIKQLSNLYEKQANTDELTSLFNRRYFNNFLKLAILTLGDTGKLHVAMFDIDDFKYVNDKFGHPFGDKILKAFANVLLSISEKNGCTVCRYGGEEFLLLIPKKEKEAALAIVEEILEYTRTNIRVTDDRCITVSAGLYTCTADMDYEALLQAVDKNLYTAKCTGKNRVVFNDAR